MKCKHCNDEVDEETCATYRDGTKACEHCHDANKYEKENQNDF